MTDTPYKASAETDVIKQNTAIAEKAYADGDAIRSCQLAELELQLSKNGATLTATAVRDIFSDIFGDDIISADFLNFCKRLKSENVADAANFPVILSAGTTARTDNSLSKAAAEILCPDARADLYSDLKSVCEAVFYEKADFCILPVCTAEDGYYPSFFRLVKAYDLKVCKCMPVSIAGRDGATYFALLSRDICLPERTFGSVLFSFNDNGTVLADLLKAFTDCGFAVPLIYSFPDRYSQDSTEFTVCVKGAGDMSCVPFFLDAVLPSHTLMGIF